MGHNINFCGYIKESINEGFGIRSVIFISGCQHYCKGCHNAESWNFNYGKSFSLEEQLKIIEDIKTNPLLDGITIVGGDPFFSASKVLDFIMLLKKEIPSINIWIYSGFTFEQILNSKDNNKINLLKSCDVLVDGLYVESERDVSLPFRGSQNQKIIDIKKSLNSNEIVLIMT